MMLRCSTRSLWNTVIIFSQQTRFINDALGGLGVCVLITFNFMGTRV